MSLCCANKRATNPNNPSSILIGKFPKKKKVDKHFLLFLVKHRELRNCFHNNNQTIGFLSMFNWPHPDKRF